MKSIPCSIILNDVALPMSSPKGMTVAPCTFKTAKVDSLRTLPPVSNSILLYGAETLDVLSSSDKNLTPVSYTHLTLPTNREV